MSYVHCREELITLELLYLCLLGCPTHHWQDWRRRVLLPRGLCMSRHRGPKDWMHWRRGEGLTKDYQSQECWSELLWRWKKDMLLWGISLKNSQNKGNQNDLISLRCVWVCWCVCARSHPPTYSVPGVSGGVSGGLSRVPRVTRRRCRLRGRAKYVHQVQHGWLQKKQKVLQSDILLFAPRFVWVMGSLSTRRNACKDLTLLSSVSQYGWIIKVKMT